MDREVYLITSEDERRLGTVYQLLNPESGETFIELVQAIRHQIAEMVFGPEDKETASLLVEIR